jgi:hypothetical protein
VVVLPVHLGPSINTAPNASSRSFSILSATLEKYFIVLYLLENYGTKIENLFQSTKRIGVFVANQSVFLRCFGRCFCGKSIGVFAVS